MQPTISQNLTFKKPDINDKDAILTFRREFNAVFDALHGANELNAFTDGGFVGWLNYLAAPAGSQWFEYAKVADSTYIALLDNRVVGICHLRHTLTDRLLERGGHIGYSTHPNFQGQGIASALLKFAVNELKKLGIDKVLVTCDSDNIGSKKVILKNGGILENTLFIQSKTESYHLERYWITA